MIPEYYFGWTIIFLAVLRFFNRADLSERWKFAVSVFTALYSLGKLTQVYISADFANALFLLSTGAIIIPFLKLTNSWLKNAERVSETSLLLGLGIIVLLS